MFKNLSGQMVGFWLVGETFMRDHVRFYSCLCTSCGIKKEVRSHALVSGKTKSCLRCVLVKRNKESSTHNETKTRLYKRWDGMKRRVKDEEKNYLALQIKICPEWEKFENFRDWALKNGYKDGLTIERKNPFGDYEPSNCTFVTNKEQQANKLNTIRLADGSMAWLTAQANGISRNAFDNRRRRGWSIEDACTKPIRKAAEVFARQG